MAKSSRSKPTARAKTARAAHGKTARAAREASAHREVTAHYIANSHWDREWYEPFQHYRFRLVDVMDGAMDLLEKDPEYRCWHMDGQSILIEDYLEICPEGRERLQALFDSGRLLAGPWYVMPDEFIPCGESLVRNLLRGHQVAGEYTDPMKVGFVCDIFGHNSQFPQILNGFGIDTAVVWRGTEFDGDRGLFRWQASDGSEVLTYNFLAHGYGHVLGYVRIPSRMPDGSMDLAKALEGLHKLTDFEAGRVPGNAVMLFDGGDHVTVVPEASKLFALARKDGMRVLHSSLPEFFEAVREQKLKLAVCRGELRYAPAAGNGSRAVLYGVLSSRMYLKQANARCENRLLHWAEPFGALASWLGDKTRPGFLREAWKFLLMNQPHDSMCGCSLDQVHRDMMYRFDQCRGIADRATHLSLRAVADRTRLPQIEGDEDSIVTVFNPTSEPIDGIVDLPLYFQRETPFRFVEGTGYEPIIGFRLYDTAGSELAYQRLDVKKAAALSRWDPVVGFTGHKRERVRIAAKLSLPPQGWTTLVCKPVHGMVRSTGTQLVNDHTMENDSLRVRINGNGTIDLTDRKADRTYRNLMTFEEQTDVGDGWYHRAAVNEEVFTSAGASADIALIHDGFALTTFRVRVVMNVPQRFLLDQEVLRRSDTLVPLEITSWLTLRAGSPYLEVRTEVNNTVRDHRLRVMFPSGLHAKTYFADSPYDVVERPIALSPDSHLKGEPESETKPQYSFTAVNDGKLGLAVISTGQPESAVRDMPERPIALTLFRGFPHTVGESDGDVDCQMLGPTRHVYWIYPHSGPVQASALLRLGQRLAAGIECVYTDARRLKRLHDEPTLPATGSWLTFGSGALVMTACKRSEDGTALIVRAFNPTDKSIEQKLESMFKIKTASYADLLEQPTDALPVRGKSVTITAGPRKIVTVRLELQPTS
ncbi:MAG: hypothetical protein JW889_13085 [Verrucomicrobia bacterium]|nr:hypothetical protein [Verrucomicrobiota bacterium]